MKNHIMVAQGGVFFKHEKQTKILVGTRPVTESHPMLDIGVMGYIFQK